MDCIVAVDKNWGIGKNGDLLVTNREDMQFFRETTRGSIVIMGRKTLESFPGGRPLKGRVNLVLSSSLEETETEEEGTVLIFRKTREAVRELVESGRFPDRKVFVIGGGSIYRLFLPECRKALVTQMDQTFEADTFFPDLDKDPDWEKEEEGEWRQGEGFRFRFCTYRRTN